MMQFRSLYKCWFASERGHVGMMFALAAVPVFGAAGIAIDFGQAAYARSSLQSATDAAAIGAAKSGISQADRGSLARSIFSANVKNSAYVRSAVPVASITADSVSVSSSIQMPTTLARLLGRDYLTVQATSKAATAKFYGNAAPACVLALSKSANGAFYVNGTTNFEAVNCGVYTNSAAPESLRAVGAPDVIASNFCTVGGYDVAGNFLPMPMTGCSAVPDPFSGLVAPASDDCAGSEQSLVLKKGEHNLSPGTYCGGLELMAQAIVTFQPGVYVIKGGPLIFRSGSTSTGSNVGFYLTGSNAALKVNGGADVDFHAASSGPLAGLFVAQDPTANPGDTSIVQGGGTVKLVGAIYFPTQIFEISGNGDLGQDTTAWAIVADQVHLKGNGSVRIEAKFVDESLPDVTALDTDDGPRMLN